MKDQVDCLVIKGKDHCFDAKVCKGHGTKFALGKGYSPDRNVKFVVHGKQSSKKVVGKY